MERKKSLTGETYVFLPVKVYSNLVCLMDVRMLELLCNPFTPFALLQKMN